MMQQKKLCMLNCISIKTVYYISVINWKRHLTPNIHIFLKFESEAEIQTVYDSLKKEGEVEKELGQSFWGTLHAVVIDKNGITWDLDK